MQLCADQIEGGLLVLERLLVKRVQLGQVLGRPHRLVTVALGSHHVHGAVSTGIGHVLLPVQPSFIFYFQEM